MGEVTEEGGGSEIWFHVVFPGHNTIGPVRVQRVRVFGLAGMKRRPVLEVGSRRKRFQPRFGESIGGVEWCVNYGSGII